jgi:hypothetical protein
MPAWAAVRAMPDDASVPLSSGGNPRLVGGVSKIALAIIIRAMDLITGGLGAGGRWRLARWLLWRLPPETAHNRIVGWLAWQSRLIARVEGKSSEG